MFERVLHNHHPSSAEILYQLGELSKDGRAVKNVSRSEGAAVLPAQDNTPSLSHTSLAPASPVPAVKEIGQPIQAKGRVATPTCLSRG
jgi:hypothetical protein